MDQKQVLYESIETYAAAKGLTNTLKALPLVREMLADDIRITPDFNREGAVELTYFEHCFSSALMIISLGLPLSLDEEDVLMAATLSHHIQKPLPDLDPRVFGIVSFLGFHIPSSAKDKRNYYQAVERNRLALLLALADRGNLMEHLHELSISEAMLYVHDTRTYFLPMCIYAKENFPEIQMSVNILMEKLRCLCDIAEIVTARYQQQEMSYTNEILTLKEENARIRGLIRMMKENAE